MLLDGFTILDPRLKHAWCKSHEAELIESYVLMGAATMPLTKQNQHVRHLIVNHHRDAAACSASWEKLDRLQTKKKTSKKELQEYFREECLPENTDPLLYR